MAKIHEKAVLGQRGYGFALYEQLSSMDFPDMEINETDIVETNDPKESLFAQIFSVNPLTGLPDGDVAMYLSEKVNPDVKRFIEMNLHSPVDLGSDTSGQFSDLSDDDVAEFTRASSESFSEYSSRVYHTLLADRISLRKISSESDKSNNQQES